MHKPQEQVREFHRVVLDGPTSPAEPMMRNPVLRARLILEEAFETAAALVGVAAAQTIAHEQILQVSMSIGRKGVGAPDLVEAIDGLCDTIVVCYGTAEDMGVDLEPFFDEVHAANMRKADGPVDAGGKKGKPPGWQPPDIAGVLKRLQEPKQECPPCEEDSLGCAGVRIESKHTCGRRA